MCSAHGQDGKGRIGDDAYGDEAVVFEQCGCSAQNCDVHYCRRHLRRLRACEVCIERTKSEMSLGMYDTPGPGGPPGYCRRHITSCQEPLSGSDDEERYDGRRAGEACNWLCCDYCLEEHDWHNENEL